MKKAFPGGKGWYSIVMLTRYCIPISLSRHEKAIIQQQQHAEF